MPGTDASRARPSSPVQPPVSVSRRGYLTLAKTYRGGRTAARRLSASGRQLPSFLILGAAKAGTTSLHDHLGEHPRVAPPVIKEIHYFDRYYHRGPRWYRAHFQRHGNDGRIAGESTPYYLFHPLVPQRVATDLPEAKLIVLLRNPIDRAVSQHNHECADANEDLSLEQALAAESDRLHGEEQRIVADPRCRSFSHQHHSYLARGRYAEQLQRWFAEVERERILVLSAEELFERPAETVATAQRFLGLEPRPPRDLAPRNARSYAPLPTTLRDRLRAEFEPHNQRLYELLGRDFGWD